MLRPEQELQQTIVKHLRAHGNPGLVWWHTPMNIPFRGHKAVVAGGILQSMGALRGVSDLVGVLDSKFYALELKVVPNLPTEPQLAFISAINSAGGFATWCQGLDAALRILTSWGWLKGKIA